MEFPEDLTCAIIDFLTPLKNPPFLSLNIYSDESNNHLLKKIKIPISSTLLDEMDVATLLWTVQMELEQFQIDLPKTFCARLESKDLFRALWTSWRDTEGVNISYEFKCHTTGSIFSGKRRKENKKKIIEEWDGKFTPFQPLPSDRSAGRKALSQVQAANDNEGGGGIPVEFQVTATHYRSIDMYRYDSVRLGVEFPNI